MKSSIADLLKRAAVAPPPEKPSRSIWRHYLPVVHQLMTNGHSVFSSVEWLIDEGEIKPAERQKAYRALLALHNRHLEKERRRLESSQAGYKR